MRTRSIKPSFWKNEVLATVSAQARLLFQGLWCLADREGRLEDRPMRIKAEVFPYENVKCNDLLNVLQKINVILRYEIEGRKFIQILSAKKHLTPFNKESQSVIPEPPSLSLARDKLEPSYINSNSNKLKVKGTSNKKKEAPENYFNQEIPYWLNTDAFKETWLEWCEFRKETKKKLTKISVKQQIKKLANMGEVRAIAALENSIANGYQGIVEPNDKNNGGYKNYKQTKEAEQDRIFADLLGDESNDENIIDI